jgi:hypothetical protein
MKPYKSKAELLSGSSYDEVLVLARREFDKIQKIAPRRNAYVRSTYFSKSKVFVSPLYWNHLMQEHRKNRVKRLKFYKAAIDLLRNSRFEPHTIFRNGDYLHRFYGITKEDIEYCVQVKQDKRTGRLDFMSVFDKKLP